MPDAGRTHGPPAAKNAGGSHHRFSRYNRHSPRNGLRLIRGLLGAPGCLATVVRGIIIRKLDPSIGGSGPHDFTVRENAFVGAASALSSLTSTASRFLRP